MLARCAECRAQIRDCTAIERGKHGHRVVQGWYHTSDGHERCRGRATMARPEPLINVRCLIHRAQPLPGCRSCDVSAQVMIVFHNDDRCIPSRCVWPHAR